MGANSSRKSFVLDHAGVESRKKQSPTRGNSIKKRDPDSSADISTSQFATVETSRADRLSAPIAPTSDNTSVAMTTDHDSEQKVSFSAVKAHSIKNREPWLCSTQSVN